MKSMLNKVVIQHLLFWILFILLWSAHDLVFHHDYLDLLYSNAYTTILYIPLVYFNLYYLVPNLLLKKRQTAYLIAIGSMIVLATFASSWNYGFYFTVLRPEPSSAKLFLSNQGKIILMTDILVLVGISMTLYLLREWYQKERYAREVEQKRLETELHLLKSQINPHFLFNSLNSIYVMLGKDQNAGRHLLLKFSDILSHQLYETQQDRVSLKKELENLKNYIGIERIRHDDLGKVNLDLPNQLNGQKIAPMLLMPIVENAFKHGQSSNGYWIDIALSISPDQSLKFKVENSYNERKKRALEGIGLPNLRRRLDLIYPERFQLQVEKENGIFKVNLNLDLND